MHALTKFHLGKVPIAIDLIDKRSGLDDWGSHIAMSQRGPTMWPDPLPWILH